MTQKLLGHFRMDSIARQQSAEGLAQTVRRYPCNAESFKESCKSLADTSDRPAVLMAEDKDALGRGSWQDAFLGAPLVVHDGIILL